MIDGIKILIVDDDSIFCENLKELLSKHGYNPFTTSSGKEALDMVVEDHFQLVITDFKMPNMSGYEVVGRLKEDRATQDISILIVSGYEIETDKFKDYTKTKAIPMLGKPVRINELERLAEYLL